MLYAKEKQKGNAQSGHAGGSSKDLAACTPYDLGSFSFVAVFYAAAPLNSGAPADGRLSDGVPTPEAQQLDFEFTRLPVILSAYSVFLKEWPHPTYRALMSEHELGRMFFLANWNAIASVIAAVHFALGEPKDISTDTESLKSAVDAFQKRNPRVYEDVKRWASAVGSRHRGRAEMGGVAASG